MGVDLPPWTATVATIPLVIAVLTTAHIKADCYADSHRQYLIETKHFLVRDIDGILYPSYPQVFNIE